MQLTEGSYSLLQARDLAPHSIPSPVGVYLQSPHHHSFPHLYQGYRYLLLLLGKVAVPTGHIQTSKSRGEGKPTFEDLAAHSLSSPLGREEEQCPLRKEEDPLESRPLPRAYLQRLQYSALHCRPRPPDCPVSSAGIAKKCVTPPHSPPLHAQSQANTRAHDFPQLPLARTASCRRPTGERAAHPGLRPPRPQTRAPGGRGWVTEPKGEPIAELAALEQKSPERQQSSRLPGAPTPPGPGAHSPERSDGRAILADKASATRGAALGQAGRKAEGPSRDLGEQPSPPEDAQGSLPQTKKKAGPDAPAQAPRSTHPRAAAAAAARPGSAEEVRASSAARGGRARLGPSERRGRGAEGRGRGRGACRCLGKGRPYPAPPVQPREPGPALAPPLPCRLAPPPPARPSPTTPRLPARAAPRTARPSRRPAPLSRSGRCRRLGAARVLALPVGARRRPGLAWPRAGRLVAAGSALSFLRCADSARALSEPNLGEARAVGGGVSRDTLDNRGEPAKDQENGCGGDRRRSCRALEAGGGGSLQKKEGEMVFISLQTEE
uniref:translation initiation factor IF-2-like n=1 Tax=Callithrix jacchus TaxID=9483 RepID=UPI0023DD0E74|nr:translation initiation factor IF-2-like [Callithrix jacchus]